MMKVINEININRRRDIKTKKRFKKHCSMTRILLNEFEMLPILPILPINLTFSVSKPPALFRLSAFKYLHKIVLL